MTAGELIASARRRHGLDQRALARRARTSQAQISRIERGVASPSVATLERLLGCMAEELQLASRPFPHGNRPTDELQADFRDTSPPDRIRQAAELSHALGGIASQAAGRS